MKAIIGKKVGMSQIFDENGHVIPVTVIEAGPCVVVQKKTSEKEGYEAVQLGFEDISERKLTKPEKGHLDKAGVAPKKYLREFDLENAAELNVGDIVKADAFQAGDFVDVTGISKGHGYQGVIKRHGAHRLKETHGSGPVARQIGSLGATSHMSQIFDENGHVIPVTVIEAGPCVVVQKKTSEKEGYEAVQLGFEDISERKLTKPEKGHLDKAGVAPKKYLREFDLENAAELNVGDIVKADAFQAGDFVDVTGISKGHGYQGVIKRHGAHRLKETHGSGPVARQIGSLGATSHMSKIIKGTIGAGHMGVEQVTVQNLSVVKVDPELNMLVVCGAIPGPKGGLVTIKSTVKVHKVKQAGADISKNPQKASGRNPQKASARNK